MWKGALQEWDFSSQQLEHAAFDIITATNIISLIAATAGPWRPENSPTGHLLSLFLGVIHCCTGIKKNKRLKNEKTQKLFNHLLEKCILNCLFYF